MFGYEDISLNLGYPGIYFFAALIVVAGYAFYVYRFTIPPVSKIFKTVLVSLRTLALLLLLFIFFEPIVSFTRKIILEPVNLIFVDNSRSLKIDDGTNRMESTRDISNFIAQNLFSSADEFYLFGENVREIQKDSINKINFEDAVTNISDIFTSIKHDDKNYASVLLITDGVITSGSNSISSIKTLGLPVFAIALGDTSDVIDVSVKRVLHNDLLYTETPSTIETAIQQSGLSGKNVTLSLFEDNTLIEQKNIVLSSNGIQNETFTYNPVTPGEKKLSVVVSQLNNELSRENNRKVFYVNVLSGKVRVLLLSGSPSADLTFIKNCIKEDDNFNVNSITELTTDKVLNSNQTNFIDSADVFFLIGFPSSTTTPGLLSRVTESIENNNVPFFILLSEYTDLNKLNALAKELPFAARTQFGGTREVQIHVFENQSNNPIIQNNSSNIIGAWNNLPPVYQSSYEYISKPGSEIIAKTKINNNVTNSPLLVSRNFNGKRSIAVLGYNIWKWKLQTVREKHNLFDNFITNSVKWLNSPDKFKRVSINSLKKNYSLGEQVEFSAQVYDESLNPVSGAEIRINISSPEYNYELMMQSRGNGIYEGNININTKGDYKYKGIAALNGEELGNDNGVFNVGDLNIEMVNPKMDYNFLKLLAKETKGDVALADNYSGLIDEIRRINENASREKFISSDFTLWSDEWMMIIVILLFSAEWFLRKRAGML